MSLGSSELDTDFSKMPATFLELESFTTFVRGYRGVDHRAQIHCIQSSDHINLTASVAYSNSVQCLLSPHKRDSRNLAGEPCQHANEDNSSSDAGRVD